MNKISNNSGASVRELTLRVIILGLVLSVVMGAANVYLGLKAGMTVSASIPAAVIGMLILRGLFRTGTVLEANQIQTAASAGESLAAGIIFTMPALVIIGIWQEFDMVMTTAIAFTGGLLGILFMIPMRRVFVTGDNPELKFPEGVACAAVLQASDDDSSTSGAKSIIIGTLYGGAFKGIMEFFGIIKHTLENAVIAGSRVFYLGADISPALVAVGFIVRLNVSLLIFIGGAIGWLIAMPIIGGADGNTQALDSAWGIWKSDIRYIGVGAMVVGGVAAIIRVRHSLVSAVVELKKRAMMKDTSNIDIKDRDLNSKFILFFSLIAVFMVGIIYYLLTSNLAITAVTTVIMLVMSFFFTAVASYIVGLVGNSNSPVSGMTITAVLFTGALLLIFGFSGRTGMLATLGVAAIVCCAACTSGDVCNDLKTGQLVGASPFRQQIMQIAGVAVAAFVMAPIMQLLHNQYVIGSRLLSAPQAGLFASLVQAFYGEGTLPWDMVAVGVVIGVVMVIIDEILKAKGSTFRAHVMPIAVGMYLPFGLALPILFGGLISHFLSKGLKSDEAQEKKLRKGVLFSSGIIAGESLMGVGIAILASIGIGSLKLELSPTVVTAITAILACATLGIFYIASRNSEK